MKEIELQREGTISKERILFLIESSRTSHEELIFRIKHRDDWLKIQLLAQVVMLALSFGIEIGGVKATSPIPIVIGLAIPTSFILACLYVIEDNLVGYITSERGKFSNTEAQMFPSEAKIELFEASKALIDYKKTTLPIRLAAQLGAFLLIPAGLEFYRLRGIAERNELFIYELIVNAVLALSAFSLIVTTFSRRRSMIGQKIADEIDELNRRTGDSLNDTPG